MIASIHNIFYTFNPYFSENLILKNITVVKLEFEVSL